MPGGMSELLNRYTRGPSAHGGEMRGMASHGASQVPSMGAAMGSAMGSSPVIPGSPEATKRQDRPSALDTYVNLLIRRKYGPPGQPPTMRGRLM